MSFNSSNGGNDNRKQMPRANRTDEPMQNTTTNSSSTFDKLIIYLTKLHPEYSVSEFTEALSIYRQEQQTLAGIPLKQIEENVLNIIRRKYPPTTENVTNNVSSEDADETEQSVTAVLWKTFKRFREQRETSAKTATNDQIKKEEQCAICLEHLNLHKTETFSCQHTFHRKCLEEWFKIERTCPLCRTILLFNDEYPDLK